MGKLKLGAQLFTLREFMKTPDDFYRTMEKVAEIGYKYVQVSGVNYQEITADVIAKAVKDTGLKVVITHTPLQRILEEPEKVIEDHNMFGCDIIGLGFGGDYLKSYEGFRRLAMDTERSARLFADAGKVFSYHNHYQEFEKKNGKHFIDAFLESSDPSCVKITADVYWLHYAGLNESDWLRAHADRISCTHFKDLGVFEGKQTIIEVMEGNLDYPTILKTCAECGIEYNFAELDTTTIEPFAAMKLSYDNLMSTGYFEK